MMETNLKFKSIKFIFFFIAFVCLALISHQLKSNNLDVNLILSTLGLFFIMIDFGVNLDEEKISKKISFKDLFAIKVVSSTNIELLAYYLGKLGFLLVFCSFLLAFIN